MLVDVAAATVMSSSESMSEEFAMEEAGREVAMALRPLGRRPVVGAAALLDFAAAGKMVSDFLCFIETAAIVGRGRGEVQYGKAVAYS